MGKRQWGRPPLEECPDAELALVSSSPLVDRHHVTVSPLWSPPPKKHLLHARGCRALSLLLLTAWLGLGSAGRQGRDHTDAPIRSEEGAGLLREQADCWNRGDLEGFVARYTGEAPLTFLTGRGLTQGRDDLLANYKKGYPDAASRGVLTFGLLHHQQLGADHALVLGVYHLQRNEPAGGYFSLVIRREKDGALAITHDHTSAADGDLPAIDPQAVR